MHACPAPQSCPTLHNPVDFQAPLSRGFFGQEYWSGLPFPSPGDLPNPGIKPACISCLAGGFFITEPPGKPCISSMAIPISHYEIEIKQITHIVTFDA